MLFGRPKCMPTEAIAEISETQPNVMCQLVADARSDPNETPSAIAKVNPTLMKAIAKPRFSAGTNVPANTFAPGTNKPAAIPRRTFAINNDPKLGEKAAKMLANVNTHIVATIRSRREMRLVIVVSIGD